jgi:hypothetical protein
MDLAESGTNWASIKERGVEIFSKISPKSARTLSFESSLKIPRLLVQLFGMNLIFNSAEMIHCAVELMDY